MYLVGFAIEIYYDARHYEGQKLNNSSLYRKILRLVTFLCV